MIDDVIGKLIADKYRVESLIAERESGDLFRGKNEMLDRPVTIKLLSPALAIDPRWVKVFLNEARAASSVVHQSIPTTIDFGTDAKGLSFAVYEEIEGAQLSKVLTDDPVFSEKKALDITRQVAAGLSAAHERKIIHGKLTASLIFIDEAGPDDLTVKVVGMGGDPLSVPRDAEPRYLGPEQCTAFPVADERTDVYALGVILYEMLTGVVPYDGTTTAEVATRQNSEPPAPLSAFRRDLHADIEPIVLTAIATDPERRYQTVKAFAEDLDLLIAAVDGKQPAVAAAAGRNIWQTAFVVLAGISLLAAALIYATSVRQTDPTTQMQASDLGGLPVQPIGPATGAQEESLARLPALTDAEIMSSAAMQQMQSDLPGGDGYNAWANGGVPPPGAPLNSQAPPLGYVPPGGQMYTIDPNAPSQFMPNLSGIDLRCMDPATRQEIPCPNAAAPAERPQDKPKTPANANINPEPVASPKPLATPPPKTVKTPAKPAPEQPDSEAGSAGNNSDSDDSRIEQ